LLADALRVKVTTAHFSLELPYFYEFRRTVVHSCGKHEEAVLRWCQFATPIPVPPRGLPEKLNAKNFVSLITYPHSEMTHFENGRSQPRT
jgi:hypothetical protein